jgi:mRNA-degrading endonuclease RelE of RelBE toxin-antitoxin system
VKTHHIRFTARAERDLDRMPENDEIVIEILHIDHRAHVYRR